MAIQKSVTLANGVTGNFWKTEQISLAPNLGAVHASLRLYETAAAYVSGGMALHAVDVDLAGTDNPCMMQDIAALIEAKLVTVAGNFLSGTVV